MFINYGWFREGQKTAEIIKSTKSPKNIMVYSVDELQIDEMRFSEVRLYKKVFQPLKELPSWLVLATILSYSGFTYEIHDLLRKLSKKSRAYRQSYHRPILDYFLTLRPPQPLTSLKMCRKLKHSSRRNHLPSVGFNFDILHDFDIGRAGEKQIFKVGY